MSDCGCVDTTPCNSQDCGCKFEVDASCVRYTNADLTCIGATKGDILEKILQNINSKLCDLVQGTYLQTSVEPAGVNCSAGGTKLVVRNINTDAVISTEYLCTAAALGSVTGLNTDNTDPLNPIVKISVDGTTVTGLGTPASPLVASSGIAGSGLNNYVARWTPDGNTLGYGVIRDDGTTTSIGTAPASTNLFKLVGSYDSVLHATNNKNGAFGAVLGTSLGSGVDTNYGGFFAASNSSTLNIGTFASAISVVAGVNVGLHALANNSSTDQNYAIQLQDPTVGIGKVLTCMTTGGHANWADANPQKEITTSNYILTNADNDYTIFINNGATAISISLGAITIPNFSVGFIQEGSADVTFVGVTNPVGLKSKGQGYQTFIERKLSTATYYLLGNTKV